MLALDADNVVVRDPEFLFSAEPYLRTGAVFWPDRDRLSADREIWGVVGVEYRDEPEVESGQLLINKRLSWHALNVAMFMNEWSDIYYRFIHGDKETFHLAWRKVGQEYAMPDRGVEFLVDTMCHHDFDGARIFQHRNYRKWQLVEPNEPVPGFWLEDACLQFVDELRRRWSVSNASQGAGSDLYARIVNQREYMYLQSRARFQTHFPLERWLCRCGIRSVGAPLECRRLRRSSEAVGLGRPRCAVRTGVRRWHVSRAMVEA